MPDTKTSDSVIRAVRATEPQKPRIPKTVADELNEWYSVTFNDSVFWEAMISRLNDFHTFSPEMWRWCTDETNSCHIMVAYLNPLTRDFVEVVE